MSACGAHTPRWSRPSWIAVSPHHPDGGDSGACARAGIGRRRSVSSVAGGFAEIEADAEAGVEGDGNEPTLGAATVEDAPSRHPRRASGKQRTGSRDGQAERLMNLASPRMRTV